MTLLRKRAGLTMTALSERIGVTPSYISLLESGERQPSRDVVDKLADVFFESKEINARDELRMLAGLSPVQTDKIIAPHDIRTTYEQMLERDPGDFRTFAALVRVLLKDHESELARQKIHEGLRRFTTSYQLQALLSQLELSHAHYQGAETAQKAAIEQFHAQPPELQKLHEIHADLYTSLGVIYYLWGSSQYEREDEASSNSRARALDLFRLAREQYDRALEIAPEDVYLLDEYARLCFHLARLSEGPEQKVLWEISIRTFRKVICAENNAILGPEEIREACICMAQACSHAGRHEEAELILVLTRSMSPQFWPAHYALACLHSLQYEQLRETSHLDKALNSLRQAFKLQQSDTGIRQMARTDPDLNPLRAKRRKLFEDLIKEGEDVEIAKSA
ncbi:MAG: hypothetical protein CVV27_00805 [Candidatus Melainabacteria bacterium HGW-Melainabacteria-1]|nr:MAG: hypothetical protein CVV27_00805 [Candidatus Melainabacteria bacterium HGW-Melainabacteria-1]